MFENLTPIIEKFQIYGKLQKVHPIEIGHINQTYQIISQKDGKQAAYILQRINNQVFKQPIAVMENIAQVGTYLKEQSYPKEVLLPIQSKAGASVVMDAQNGYWRLFPFIENTKTYNEVDSEEKAYQAAYTFGEYMHYLEHFDASKLHYTIPDFHNTNLRYQQFYHTLKKAAPEKIKPIQDKIDRLLNFRYLLGVMQRIKLPLRVVHSDTKINNILFDKDTSEAVCVIDLDTLMPGSILYDYGDMVRTFTPPVDENSADYKQVLVRNNILEALTDGYLTGLAGSLTALERDLLLYGAQLIVFEQALRFLTDYLQGNVYYKVEYQEQNLVRASNQIYLLEDLVRKVKR
jgi:thiamine kinase-like enzyme